MTRKVAPPVSNLAAAESMVAAMRSAGRLESVDDALVQAVLSLAAAVDSGLGQFDARLWGQYQAAVRSLREVGKGDADGDEIERLIAAIRGAPSVVDAADGSADARGRGRKGR